MSNIVTHEGRTSYVVENETVKVYATAQGGQVTAEFQTGGGAINPFFIAPWWKEGWVESFDSGLMNALRGNFFCFPFGGDADGVLGGKPLPTHGPCANGCWSMEGVTQSGDAKTLQMRFEEDDCRITKKLRICKGESVIYEENTLEGYDMKAPVAYHPTLRLPDAQGAAHLCVGGAKAVYTSKQDFELPENKGYTLFKLNQKLDNMNAVPTAFGTTVDVARQPVPFGYEDILLFVNDDSREFCFSALTYPEGYIYFQIKNPRDFQSTMLWLSNGGRHFAPWNGRVRSVMGIEEATANFCYGAKASVEPNALGRDGVRTYITLSKDKPTRLGIICGLVEVPKGFSGVKDMVKTDDGVEIIGLGAQRVQVKVDLGFLQ